MAEEKTNKPNLFNQALRAVKGDNTKELVEEFTSEMTLVAEGLCEDQARLRKQVEDLTTETDRTAQRTRSEVEALEVSIQENQRDLDRRLDELTHRLQALEAREKQQKEASKAKEKKGEGKGNFLQQLTVLVSIVAGAVVLIAILNLFR